MITIKFFDSATPYIGQEPSVMTRAAFLDANADDFNTARCAEIETAIRETGRYVGYEGAGGDWMIEAVS